MTFTPKNWIDSPSTSTPLSAAAIEDLETRVTDYTDLQTGSVFGVESPGAAVDARPLIQAAITAAAGAGVVQLGPGTFLLNTTGPLSLPTSAAGLTIQGAGMGATTIKLTTTCPRAFDMDSTADFQTFQNITVQDLTVDSDSFSTSTARHIVLGNLIVGGGWEQRANFYNIAVRRVRTVNVPVTGATPPIAQHVSIGSTHPSAGGTQTSLRRILVEDCDFSGGNVGVAILGTSGAVDNPNVYLDDITIRNVRHDTGAAPTSLTNRTSVEAFAHIGSLGIGDRVTIQNCYGANYSDVGIEIDGMTNALVDGVALQDCRNVHFFARHFQAPTAASERATSVTFRNCRATVSALAPTGSTYGATGYQLGSAAAGPFGTASPTLQRITLENCSYYNASASMDNGGAIQAQTPVANIELRNFKAIAGALNYTPGGATNIGLVTIIPSVDCTVKVRDLYLETAGTVNTNVTAKQFYLSPSSGKTLRFDVEGMEIASSLAGISSGATYGLDIGESGGTVGAGVVSRFRVGAWSGADTSPRPILVLGSGTVTISKAIRIVDCDFTNCPGSVEVWFPSGSNQNKVLYRDNLLGGTGYPASVASAASITLPPTDFMTLTGTTAVTSITAGAPQQKVTLVNTSTASLTDGSNLKLSANGPNTADDSISLVCDGTNWYETGRSVN